MNANTRMRAALRGVPTDRVPWTIYAGLLPRGATERELRSRGLGLLAHAATYSMSRPNVHVVEQSGEEGGHAVRIRTYRTPVGVLTEKRRSEPGYNSSWAVEHFVKAPRDYAVLEYIIRDTRYCPSYDTFTRAQAEMGDDGLVNASVLRVPFQRLWIEFTGLERLLLDLHDHPEPVGRVLDAMAEKDRELFEIVANSPAEFVWAPDNVSAQVMGPQLFDRYFAPHYHALCDIMHRHGKRVYAHMDGSMRPLLDCVARLPLDIVEAFTPAPNGDVTVAEARAAWKDKVIWINFPSGVHIQPPEEIAAVTRDLLRQAAPGDGFLVGVTENIPSFAYATSLTAITETIEQYGTLPLQG